MTITRLSYQKTTPGQVNVYIDDKFVASLNGADVLGLGLCKGQEIDPQIFQKILNVAKIGKYYNQALFLISKRPRSEREIRDHLARKIKIKNLIDPVIDRLKHLGQIDDLAFAKWFLEQRSQFKQKGSRAVKVELQRKGVDREIIDQVISGRDRGSEIDLAEQAALKKLPTLRRRYPNNCELTRRLQNFLLTRGFDWDTISQVVDKLVGTRYNSR